MSDDALVRLIRDTLAGFVDEPCQWWRQPAQPAQPAASLDAGPGGWCRLASGPDHEQWGCWCWAKAKAVALALDGPTVPDASQEVR